MDKNNVNSARMVSLELLLAVSKSKRWRRSVARHRWRRVPRVSLKSNVPLMQLGSAEVYLS